MWSISSFLLHSLNETFYDIRKVDFMPTPHPPFYIIIYFWLFVMASFQRERVHSYCAITIHVPHSCFCPSQSRIWLFWGWYWTLGGHGTVYHTIPFTQHAESVSASHSRSCVWQSNSSDVTIFAPHHNDGSVFIPRQNRNLREGSVASRRRANMAE